MKLSNKQKKYFTIAGCVVLGITLIVAIGSQFLKTPTKDVLIQKEAPGMQVVVAELEKGGGIEETEILIRTEHTAQTDAEVLPAQTDQKEQELQVEVTKPEEASEESLLDSTKKPDGETVEGLPEAVAHEEVQKPEEPITKGEMPQAGDTKGGQIYIPGFGWMNNEGGGASGRTAKDMYENGNKIGLMN